MIDLEEKAKELYLKEAILYPDYFTWELASEGFKELYRNQVVLLDLICRLRKRAEIRRNIPRGEPDRIADLLEEAANQLEGKT